MKIGAVAIGRNEGERLKRCVESLYECAPDVIIYVDSGSTDGSMRWASKRGVEVVDLDMQTPFTAARARNAGLKRLQQLAQDVPYVQFIDGDCELMQGWVKQAAEFLDARPNVAAVAGRLHERYPDRSLYNWLCDREWDGPTGEVRACGGIVMMRVGALAAVGGFRDDLIAGEEPELCVRLRAAGWHIWRLGCDMARHDAAMLRFSQWWKRTVRIGYAFAQGAHLHGAAPERHFIWQASRAWLWGVFIPFLCLLASVLLWPCGIAAWLIYLLQLLRQIARNSGSLKHRALLALFQLLARFPEGWGQLRFLQDRLLGRQSGLIEHK